MNNLNTYNLFPFAKGGGSSVNPIKFNLPLTHSLVPLKGALVSFARNDSDATVIDHQGVTWDCQAEEARFQGARRGRNLISDNKFLNYILGGDEGYVEAPNNHGNVAHAVSGDLATGFIVLGTSFSSERRRNSVWLRSDTITSVTMDGQSIAISSTWQRYSRLYPTTSSSMTVNAGGGLTPSDILEYFNPQSEFLGGVFNEQPSEDITVGIGTEPELNPDTELLTESNFDFTWSDATWSSGNINISTTNGSVQYIGLSDIESINGRLYAVTITVENFVDSGTGAGIRLYGGYAGELSTAIQGDGTFTFVLRANNAGHVGELPYFYIDYFGGTVGLDCDITHWSIKEVAHGSNVDGVKYFDKRNPMYVSPGLITSLHEPANYVPIYNIGSYFTLMANPEMEGSGAAYLTDDWCSTTSGTLPELSGGKLIMNGSVLTNPLKLPVGQRVRLSWSYTGTPDIFNIAATIDILSYPKTHTIDVDIMSESNLYISDTGIGDTEVDYFRYEVLYDLDAEPQGLIAEQQVTNITPRSHGTTYAEWTKTNVTVGVANTTVGNILFQSVREIAVDGLHSMYDAGISFNNSDYTFKFFVIPDGRTWVWGRITSSGYQYFNCSGNGSVGVLGEGVDHASCELIDSVNNVYLCKMTLLNRASGPDSFNVGLATGDTVNGYLGDITKGAYVSGIDCQELAAETSHIQTEGVATQRNKDLAIYELPDSISDSDTNDFVITGEFAPPFDTADLNDGTDKFLLHVGNTGRYVTLLFENAEGGKLTLRKKLVIAQDTTTTTTFVAGTAYKFAARISSTQGLSLFINGVAEGVTNSNTANIDMLTGTGTGTSIVVGADFNGLNHANIPIKNVRVYKGDLSDTKCEELCL